MLQKRWLIAAVVAVGTVALVRRRRQRRTSQSELILADQAVLTDGTLLFSGGAPVQIQPEQELAAELLKQNNTVTSTVGNQVVVWLLLALVCSYCVSTATLSRQNLKQSLQSFDKWFLATSIITFTSLVLVVQAAMAKYGPRQRHEQAATPEEASPPPPAVLTPPQDLTGVWLKDFKASDPMDDALEAMKLNAIMRAAVRLVRGMEIKMSEDYFELSMLTPFAWFKVTERYPLNGEVRTWKRRDLRKGQHRGAVRVSSHGAISLLLEWDEPFAGRETDTFFCPQPGVMIVDTTMRLHSGRTLSYRTVHRQRA